jgi:hypothetical protein
MLQKTSLKHVLFVEDLCKLIDLSFPLGTTDYFESLWKNGCLDDCTTLHLDTVTLRPAPSDTVTIRPTNVFILRQSDPTQTAQFDPLEVGLNVGCDNPTHSLLRLAG